MEKQKTHVPALERFFKILETVANNPKISFTELYTQAGLPKSSAYLIAREMQGLGLLRLSPRGGYSLGLKLLEWGQIAAGQIDIRTEALPFLHQLRDRVQLTCHLGIFDGAEAYYLAKVEGNQAAMINSWEGKRLSLYSSSVGKALLAFMDVKVQREIVDCLELQQHTANTITDKYQLLRHLEMTRERGWAVDDEEDVPDIRCAAAPVLDNTGEVVAAISAVGTISQVSQERLPKLAQELMHTARQISERLGFLPHAPQ